jgi:hypothetical protein
MLILLLRFLFLFLFLTLDLLLYVALDNRSLVMIKTFIKNNGSFTYGFAILNVLYLIYEGCNAD